MNNRIVFMHQLFVCSRLQVSGFTKLNETFAAMGEHGAEKVSKKFVFCL